jgi:hypothetical protein
MVSPKVKKSIKRISYLSQNMLATIFAPECYLLEFGWFFVGEWA